MKRKARYGHFNVLAPYYDRLLGGMANDALIQALQLAPGQLVLDVGGGTGRVARQLVQTGARVIVADPSPQMLAQSRRKELRAVRGVVEHLPFASGSIDRVLVVDAFHHFADQTAAAAELLRVLRPGGRLIIEEPDLRHFTVKLIAVAEKLALMQSHFLSPQALSDLFRARQAEHLQTIPQGPSTLLIFSK